MQKSIKRTVAIRVVAVLVSTLLFSFMTTFNIFRIQATQAMASQANALLDRAEKAETAHYKWVTNLSNALYAGTEFTGSIDPSTCVLGQWLYGEAGTDDQDILALRSQLEPLHKELHESATYVLDLLKTDPQAATSYFQETIHGNLGTLVGLLDQVIERSSALSQESAAEMENTAVTMHITSGVCLALALFCLIGLILYVIKRVVEPILSITESSKVLQEGKLELKFNYSSKDELGQLAQTLEHSRGRSESYVTDLNSLQARVSQGD